MILKPVVYDGMIQRQLQQGDVLGGGEQIGTLTTVGAGSLTAALLLGGFIVRTGPTLGYTDTTESSNAIITAMLGNYFVGGGSSIGGVGGNAGVQPGTTFRCRFINTVAQAMTLAGGTGVTLGTTPTPSCSSSKMIDWLITITNGTPQQVFAATVDGSTKVITGMTQAQTNQLTVGMLVTGTGIAASSYITSIQPGVGVTVTNNTTVAGTLVALTFNPTVRIDAISVP